ncbi:MAG: hypothetical protein CGW95_08990 [Phenylobacterium zucineum]|nr:MAG: hypothetical protein CGW95_08990 [Phenylobacterium zucineum]
MKPRYQVSKTALEIIKRFEGFLGTAEPLADGRWMIGYGHTQSTRQGAQVSPADAEALLIYDLIRVADAVNSLTFTPLTQNQFDALCAFVYNIGIEAFQDSDVLRYLNEGRLLEAAFAMEFWRRAQFHGTSQVVDAIVRRRAAEKTLFLKPAEGWVPAPSAVLRPTLDSETLGPALNEPDTASDERDVVTGVGISGQSLQAPSSTDLSSDPAVPRHSAWPLRFDPDDRAPNLVPESVSEQDQTLDQPESETSGLYQEPIPEPSASTGWTMVDQPRVKLGPILKIAIPALAFAVGGVYWSGHVTIGEGVFHPFLIGSLICLTGLIGLSRAAYTFLVQLGYLEPIQDRSDRQG